MRLLIHFARYGPYHHARLRAAHEVLAPLGWEVIGLEIAGTDATYDWDETKGETAGPRVITAFPRHVYEEITAAEYRRTLFPLLDAIQPTHIAIAGWGSTDAQMCLAWSRKNDVRRIVMSETRAADGKRVWWKELIKRYLISRFDGALVGGKSHRDYLVSLGMPADRIALGYNVVDNAYFAGKTQDFKTQDTREEGGRQRSEVRGQESEVRSQGAEVRSQGAALSSSSSSPNLQSPISNLSSSYFLASNRFIERKNLSRLIEAYGVYGRAMTAGRALTTSEGEMQKNSLIHSHLTPLGTSGPARRSSPTWNLVLLGDGELKADLIAQCHALGLTVIESAPWEDRQTALPVQRTTQEDVVRCPLSVVRESLQSVPRRDPQTTDNRQPTTDSPASHLHLTPLAASGPARRSSPTVYFPGFRQIEDLPKFYARAGCFIHPALEEPWGLVINEAMACGLPVLSSNNVGAAEELVDDSVNGWKFDPENVEELADLMKTISAFNFPLSTFSAASLRILEERCPTQAFGKGLANLLQKSF